MAINTDVVRDAPRKDIAPVDETVVLPASVVAGQKRAEALHAAAYTPEPDPAAVAAAAAAATAAAETAAAATAAAAAAEAALQSGQPVVPVVPEPPVTTGGPDDDNDQSWKHKYLSMQGRWQASQRLVGDMQEQMSQLGDELVRTQQLVRRPAQPDPKVVTPPAVTKRLTVEDETTYGPELIDFAKRAAQEAVAPELTRLEQENQQLKKQVVGSSQREAYAQLSQFVPNWREVNRLPAWNNWLRQRDVYSGRVRHQLLNEANAAADAPRIAAFFRSFLAEAEATGQQVVAPQQQQVTTPPARVAAVTLATLAAPGRAKPASGDTALPADKPVLTRAQVAGFYANVRAGRYIGHEAEKAKDEAIIFAAQADGRIRN